MVNLGANLSNHSIPAFLTEAQPFEAERAAKCRNGELILMYAYPSSDLITGYLALGRFWY